MECGGSPPLSKAQASPNSFQERRQACALQSSSKAPKHSKRSLKLALHKDFPESPHAILDPEIRWFPADEALRATSYERLLPPLVPQLRRAVKQWRDQGYAGATETSRSLLNWWFDTPHLLPQADGTLAEFRYYFAQQEALETIIYLYDVRGSKTNTT